MVPLDPKTFKCTKCGECCRPLVKVSEQDIKRIEELGFSREEFLDYDPMEKNPKVKDTLKQTNNICMFLKRDGDEFICSIYSHRPEICQKYPFFDQPLEDCVPKWLGKPKDLKEILK